MWSAHCAILTKRKGDSTLLIIILFQFHALRGYLDDGGCILVLMTEGGEVKQNTNINFLLEEFGIMVNNGKPSRIIAMSFLHKDIHHRFSGSYCVLQIFSSQRGAHL